MLPFLWVAELSPTSATSFSQQQYTQTVPQQLLLGTGFLCPNNPLNMHAFMHEKLLKYALQYAHKNYTKY
jgi:hypothetical protein